MFRLRAAGGRHAALGIAAGPAILVLVLLLAGCAGGAAPSADARDHGFYGSATGGWTKLSAP
jgi:hypothetical protein